MISVERECWRREGAGGNAIAWGLPAALCEDLKHEGYRLSRNQNTYEKHRREAEKKRKAEEKRQKRVMKPPVESAESPTRLAGEADETGSPPPDAQSDD